MPFSEQKSREFLEAAEKGNLPLVKSFSLDPEVNLNWQDSNGRTPLWHACDKDHVDIVRYLLDFHDNQRPIDYNLEDNNGWTPFLLACLWGYEKLVEMLLDDHRFYVNWSDREDMTPLCWASYHGHVDVVKMLLASTRQIDALKESRDGRTAARFASDKGAGTWRFFDESDEDVHRRKILITSYFGILSLITSYENDPEAVRTNLRRELGCDDRWAGDLFALVVFLSDAYLKIPAEIQGEGNAQRRKDAQRFFTLASSLPLDLQMVLCNRVFGRGGFIVKRIYSEQGFKKFAREL